MKTAAPLLQIREIKICRRTQDKDILNSEYAEIIQNVNNTPKKRAWRFLESTRCVLRFAACRRLALADVPKRAGTDRKTPGDRGRKTAETRRSGRKQYFAEI